MYMCIIKYQYYNIDTDSQTTCTCTNKYHVFNSIMYSHYNTSCELDIM